MSGEFEIASFLHKDAHSSSYETVHKSTHRPYVMVVKRQKQTSVNNELMSQPVPTNPFVVHLKYTFETKARSFFVLTHTRANRTLDLLTQQYSLTEAEWKFILVELIEGFRLLHAQQAVYGAITSHDVCFDDTGHVLLQRNICNVDQWGTEECWQCRKNICTSEAHRTLHRPRNDIENDWKNLGALITDLVNSETKFLNETFHFIQSLKCHTQAIAEHEFLRDVDWESVRGKNLTIPLVIREFTAKSQKNTCHVKAPSIVNEVGLIIGHRKKKVNTQSKTRTLKIAKTAATGDESAMLPLNQSNSLEQNDNIEQTELLNKLVKKLDDIVVSSKLKHTPKTRRVNKCLASDWMEYKATSHADLRLRNKVLSHESLCSLDSGVNEIDDDVIDSDVRSVERSDSGVVTSRRAKIWRATVHVEGSKKGCQDCDVIDCDNTLCGDCVEARRRRVQSIVELIETEINYGEDLRTMKDEFYAPLKQTCTADQLNILFANLQELIDVNSKLCLSFQRALEECQCNHDYEYLYMNTGEIFLNHMRCFEVYEVYCQRHRHSLSLLNNLLNQSNVLAVFMKVTSQENEKLRKLDLKAFLAMPVQRIMKYPLLLSRVMKSTPKHIEDSHDLSVALKEINQLIETINNFYKQTNTKSLNKLGTLSSIYNLDCNDKTKLTRLVGSLLDWKPDDVDIVLQDEFRMIGETSSAHAPKKRVQLTILLCVHGIADLRQGLELGQAEMDKLTHIKDAVIILLKSKPNHKRTLYKTPLKLLTCVVSTIPSIPEALQLNERGSETITILAKNPAICCKWKECLDSTINKLDAKWRRRRNALVNIMLPSLNI